MQLSVGVAALVATVRSAPSEGSLQDSGARSPGGKFEECGRRKRIRFTKKTDVRKRFGLDPWEQPIPKRWKAATLRSAVFRVLKGRLLAVGWDFLMRMSQRELAEVVQVARSHASRFQQCLFVAG